MQLEINKTFRSTADRKQVSCLIEETELNYGKKSDILLSLSPHVLHYIFHYRIRIYLEQ